MGIQQALVIAVMEMSRSKMSLRESSKIFRRQFVLSAMERNGWNSARAAREIGVSLNTVNKLVREARQQRKQAMRADGVIEYRKRIVVAAGERFPTI